MKKIKKRLAGHLVLSCKWSALTILLFCFTPLTVKALDTSGVEATKISLVVQNKTYGEVFAELESQSGYVFFFMEEALDLNQKTDIDVTNKTLEETLNQLFAGTNNTYIVDGRQVFISKKNTENKTKVNSPKEAEEDKVDISGIVLDANGDPVIGATIQEGTTHNGTMSDIDGKFTLRNVKENAKVEIRYLGYQSQAVHAKKDGSYRIILAEDTQLMDEVIVVGYGTQLKSNLTGAVGHISGDKLKDRPVSSVSQMLQGAIPNLNVTFASGRPGQGAKFNIRGVNSISGSASPLVIIDGVEGDMERVNANDVESVTVLKDASAAAIYGARASFGVILVTTKAGEKNSKPKISYSGRYSFGSSTTSNSYETRGYYSAKINDLFFNSYAGKPYTKYTDEDYEQLWIRRNDKTEHPDRPWITTDQRQGRDTYVYYANFDWNRHLYKYKRPAWNHDVSISGGSDKINYYVSGNAFEQKGVFRAHPDKLTKYNFRGKLNVKLSDKISFSNNTKYYKDHYSYPGRSGVANTFNSATNHALASIPATNIDGTPIYTTDMHDNIVLDGIAGMLTQDKHRNRDKTDQFTTTFEVSYKPIKDLELKANYTFERTNLQTLNRSNNLTYSKVPGVLETVTSGFFDNKLSEAQKNHWYQAANAYGTYSKKIGEHSMKAMAGMNYEHKRFKDLGMSQTGLLDEDKDDFNLANGETMTITGGQNEYAILGFFTRLNYNYKGKYLAEFSGRYDGTSRFQRGDRYVFSPSGSIGWRMTEESFMKPLRDNQIDNIMLRLSYGQLANQQVGYYDYIREIQTGKLLDYSFGDGKKLPHATATAPNAKDMTWEKVRTLNFGLDFGFLGNRLTINGDYYIRDTRDMLMKGKSLPAGYGENEPKKNAANLRTKGWELMATWNDSFTVGNSPLNYTVSFALSDNTSKVTKYDNPSKTIGDYIEGRKLGEIWGYVTDGYFKTDEEAAAYQVDQTAVNNIINNSQIDKGLHAGDVKFLDLDGDDKITAGASTADKPGDRRVIGNSLPRYTYGANFSANWKGIDLSVFFQGVGRQHWYPGTSAVAFWGPYSRPYYSFIPKDFMSRVWSPDNPDAFFPRPRGYTALGTNRELGVVNDKYLQNLRYCRLKNLTIGYTLPKQWTKKLKMDKCRFYFSGENLLTITALRSKYIDPEQASASNTVKVSTSNAKTYPWPKTYSFGIDITF